MAARRVPLEAWEQQVDESDEAYAAFCAYRDMEDKRSLRGAYRLRHGGNGAYVGGTFSQWSVRFKWRERALAWDRRLSVVKTDAVLKEAERQGTDWARRRIDTCERAYLTAMALMGKAEMLSKFPVSRQLRTESEGGKTIIEPIGSADLRAATNVAAQAFTLAMEAITVGENGILPQADFDPATCDDPEKLRSYIASFGVAGAG